MADDFSPTSPWQTEAELNGAAAITDAEGNHVPYADLMARAARQMSDYRARIVALEGRGAE